ncbi:MAG: tripartite tricarboxylate transporter substrate binding protein [Proteobacteria bacterium]|nr:tripartite tricarboxylate transporter substrate binding protein [Pseudomonadota bacterium]
MKSTMLQKFRWMAALFVLSAATGALAADNTAKPDERPIRLIVPFAPGGASDVLARIIAQHLIESLKRQVIVDNRPGAGGNIGMGIVAKATPDGNVMSIASSAFVVNPSLYDQIPYDAIKDFAPITNVASASTVLVVHPSVAAKSVKELVALVKASPGKFNYASSGAGTGQHLAGELFKTTAGLDVSHIPFNGAGPAVIAVLGAQVQMGFSSLPAVRGQIANGTLRAIAVTTMKRAVAIPDVPTFDESGYPGFEVDFWQGLVMPGGTPRPVVNRMNAEMLKMLQGQEVKKRLDGLGFEAVGSSPDQFAQQIAAELAKWSKFIKQAGIKL